MIIETTIDLLDPKLNDIGIESDVLVKIALNLKEICAIREYIADDESEPDPKKCTIYLKSGVRFVANISYNQILQHLKEI